MVEASKRFDEHVDTFIPVFVTTGSEEVEGLVRVKVVVSIEVASNKVVDTLLVLLMEILELVSSGELLAFKPFGKTPSGFLLRRCSLS